MKNRFADKKFFLLFWGIYTILYKHKRNAGVMEW